MAFVHVLCWVLSLSISECTTAQKITVEKQWTAYYEAAIFRSTGICIGFIFSKSSLLGLSLRQMNMCTFTEFEKETQLMCNDIKNRPTIDGFRTVTHKPCGTFTYFTESESFQKLFLYRLRVVTVESPSSFSINFTVIDIDFLRYGSVCILDFLYLLSRGVKDTYNSSRIQMINLVDLQADFQISPPSYRICQKPILSYISLGPKLTVFVQTHINKYRRQIKAVYEITHKQLVEPTRVLTRKDYVLHPQEKILVDFFRLHFSLMHKLMERESRLLDMGFWSIVVRPAFNILISVMLDMDNDFCEVQSITIYDGPDTNNYILYEHVYEYGKPSKGKVKKTLHSSGPRLFITTKMYTKNATQSSCDAIQIMLEEFKGHSLTTSTDVELRGNDDIF